MKAIRAHQWCEPTGLLLEETPRPEPGAGEVLVKVDTAALNFPDMLMIKGTYQVKPELPFTPGLEMSGTIEQVGEGVEGLKPGMPVLAQSNMGAGGN